MTAAGSGQQLLAGGKRIVPQQPVHLTWGVNGIDRREWTRCGCALQGCASYVVSSQQIVRCARSGTVADCLYGSIFVLRVLLNRQRDADGDVTQKLLVIPIKRSRRYELLAPVLDDNLRLFADGLQHTYHLLHTAHDGDGQQARVAHSLLHARRVGDRIEIRVYGHVRDVDSGTSPHNQADQAFERERGPLRIAA